MKPAIDYKFTLMISCLAVFLTQHVALAQATTCNDLIEILQACRRSSEDKLRSFSIPYTLSIYGLKGGDPTSQLERAEHFTYHFTYAEGKWAEKAGNVHMVGYGGESFDNSIHRTYDRVERRTLFTMDTQSDLKRAPLGHIHANNNLDSSLNYTMLLDRHGADSVVDYIMQHKENAEVIDVSDDSVKLLVRSDTTPGARTIITFDPTRDFHVKEILTEDEGGNRVVKTVDLCKVADDIWLPKAGRIETFVRNGNAFVLAKRIVIEVPDPNGIEINKQYPDSTFRVNFENGTFVTDFTAGQVSYTVGKVPLDLLDSLRSTYSKFAEGTSAEGTVSASVEEEPEFPRETDSQEAASNVSEKLTPGIGVRPGSRNRVGLVVGAIVLVLCVAGVLIVGKVSIASNRQRSI